MVEKTGTPKETLSDLLSKIKEALAQFDELRGFL
jgi:hypothetical protein